jgi:hypothetical protein
LDFVIVNVCLGVSLLSPLLSRSSAILLILRRLLWPYMETATPNVNSLEYTSCKVKLSRYRPEQAHGRSGRLRPQIFLTFGTRRW